jgi:hypothetical protein
VEATEGEARERDHDSARKKRKTRSGGEEELKEEGAERTGSASEGGRNEGYDKKGGMKGCRTRGRGGGTDGRTDAQSEKNGNTGREGNASEGE